MLSSEAVLILACLLAAGGIIHMTGLLDLLSLALIGALAAGLMLMKIYLPPVVILIIAVGAAAGGIMSQKGSSFFVNGILIAMVAALALVGQIYLPAEILVRISLTIVLLAGLKWIIW